MPLTHKTFVFKEHLVLVTLFLENLD